MEQLPRKVYSLYLNTNTGFPNLFDNTSTANVKWNVDWDSLFSRENYKYKNCMLRVRLVGENNATQETSNTSGVLVGNFGQSYTGKNVSNVVIAPIDLVRANIYAAGVWTNAQAYIDINTMTDAHGLQIDVPYGFSMLNLQMWRNGYASVGDVENLLVTNAVPYYVILQFELF